MFETPHETYSFADFTLDVSSHRFLRGQNEIKLTTQPFKALLYLVKNPNKLITKDELINAVRGKDVNLTLDAPKKWIDHIRAALGNQDQMIEIVRGEGWRFNADVKVNSRTGYTTISRDPAQEVNSDTRTAAPQETEKGPTPARQVTEDVSKGSKDRTETFESWMLDGRGMVISSTLLTSVMLTSAVSIWLYRSSTLNDWAKTFACLAQAVVICIAFAHSLLQSRPRGFGPVGPDKEREIKEAGYENGQDLQSDSEEIGQALKKYAHYWRWLLISWLSLYVFLAALGYKGFAMSFKLSLFNTLLNNWNTAMLLFCFYVLNKQMKDESKKRNLVDTLFIGFAFFLLLVLATLFQFLSLANITKGASVTSGIAGAVAMALLVGRLQSKFLGPRLWLLIALYSYTAIQPLFLYLENNDKWALMLINSALVLKCLLYLYTAWLFQSGDLLFYFARVRRIYRTVPMQRKAFRELLD
jgi:DNA-binding winged helix-turn-helix (wHTH) protein